MVVNIGGKLGDVGRRLHHGELDLAVPESRTGPPRVESGTRKGPRHQGLGRRSHSDTTRETLTRRCENRVPGHRKGVPLTFMTAIHTATLRMPSRRRRKEPSRNSVRPCFHDPSRRPAEMVRTRLRLTSSVGESAFSSDLSQEPAVRAQSRPARLPVPLIHQDGGTESVQRVFEECEVVPAPEK